MPPPDPAPAATLDDLVDRLRQLRSWAGDPSYEVIKGRVNAAWTGAGRPATELVGRTTVLDCFRPGRRRLNTDLVLAIVRALCPDDQYLTRWRETLRAVSVGTRAELRVTVRDVLPPPAPRFRGRAAELDRLRRAHGRGERVLAVSGMAGVGKTTLAVRAAHDFAAGHTFDRTLFADLRGFHPDPAQGPAQPAAVLEAFLRLLDVPAAQVPHDPTERAAMWQRLCERNRLLVVLDNVAGEEQATALLATAPGCLTLVTSRRRLAGLPGLPLDVFPAAEAHRWLSDAVRETPIGPDPRAVARIAHRCGHLPLALALVAGHIRGTTGWTLTDHADRLDERHAGRRLDTGVTHALDLSYRSLPAEEQRVLRLLALHPGADADAYAAAALTGAGVTESRRRLRRLARDHLLLSAPGGRFGFHDLVRAYAMGRAGDEEPPSAQRAATAALCGYYLATATAAMDVLFPAEARGRPRVAVPATPVPRLATPEAAKAWLTAERPSLVALSGHPPAGDRVPVQLSAVLFRFLDGGHHTDALTVHGNACAAAERLGDPAAHAHALTSIGTVHGQLGRFVLAGEQFRRALPLFEQAGDLLGQARTLNNLGNVDTGLGRYDPALELLERSLTVSRAADDPASIARALGNLGNVEVKLGRYGPAVGHLREVIELCRGSGDRTSEARALTNLGIAKTWLGRYPEAAGHLRRSALLFDRLGNRTGQAWALTGLGRMHIHEGEPAHAGEVLQRALTMFRETGDREGETASINGLGRAATARGEPADAVPLHEAAIAISAETGDRYGAAQARDGLGDAFRALADPAAAAGHYRRALAIFTELGVPEAGLVRGALAALAEP
ncbi:tetratricopeptide repeat protein [Actinoplanes sp. G11-F43]|uniref:tetratricopeptide repeat protein n=1 Tax=Actinoplanes sp. G11-F43 TaxID=3424130 RepID=UPI003D3580D0